ncbi:MAG: hypothetical protein WCP98_14185 [Actinomycetes bacterium]
MSERGSVAEQLGALFARNGYVRRQNHERIAAEGRRRYKKGVEVRLTANSEEELERIRGLLRAAGFTVGKAYCHSRRQFRQPVYGRRQVERFLELVGRSRVAEQAHRADVSGS